jgi:hypothetical protein
VTVADRWQLGGVPASFCVAPPRGRARCRSAGLAPGWTRATHLVRPRRPGRWRVELRTRGERPISVRRTLDVGSGGRQSEAARPLVLIAGNSMMQSLDSVLIDRIGSRALAVTKVRIGTGLTIPRIDVLAAARRQARRLKPAVSIVFFGGNDGFDVREPGGELIACCGEPWIQAYARRARRAMTAYGRAGRGLVFWVASPAARSQGLHETAAAINEASRRAAKGLPYVRLVEIGRLLTPGFVYRDSMRWGGRLRRVRLHDGLHLTVDGARVAASLIMRRLERVAVLEPRKK